MKTATIFVPFFVCSEHGAALQVIRCDKPELAIQIAGKAFDMQSTLTFEELPKLVEKAGGKYRFMGWLGRRADNSPCILDANGKLLGECEPGDSFVTGLPTVEIPRIEVLKREKQS